MTATIQVKVNGESREVPHGLTIAALLAFLALPANRVAIERNLEISPRSAWGSTTIEAGDALEIVHLVGGG